MRAQSKRTVWLLPLLLVVVGVVLLLDNFLLIDVDLAPYWPWLLVLVGLQVLVKGDIAPSWQGRTPSASRAAAFALAHLRLKAARSTCRSARCASRAA